MDPETQQGVPVDSPPTDDTLESPAAAVPHVDPEQIVEDRPLKNIIAELKRHQQQQFDELAARLMAAPRPAPQQQREYSDEELSQLATAGDPRAHLELTRRVAARESAQHIQVQAQQQQDIQALSLLFARYPVLKDEAHELTRYASQAKYALMRTGHPDSPATIAEAIRIAIADNPELAASSMVRPTGGTVVPRATVPTAGASAPAPRRQAPTTPKVDITDDEWAAARRMGFTSREQARKAKENTEKRRQSGTSSLGYVQFIRENA